MASVRVIARQTGEYADTLTTYRHDWLTAVVDRWGTTDKETTR